MVLDQVQTMDFFSVVLREALLQLLLFTIVVWFLFPSRKPTQPLRVIPNLNKIAQEGH